MPRALAIVGLISVLIDNPAQSPASSPQLDRPMFRSVARDLVVLPITVANRNGVVFNGLSTDRFVIYDNGRPQPIAFFEDDQLPVSVALVIDDSASMSARMNEVIAASLHFARQSNPADELFVIEFNDRVRDALEGRSVSADDVDDLAQALRTLRPQGRTALYDGLLTGLDRLEQSHLSRRILVLIGDGGDNASHHTQAAVLARAKASSVAVYTIGVFDRDDRDANPGLLQALASATGGRRFLPASAGRLMQACDQIAREVRSGYTLGFEPPERDGRYHEVRVELKGPGSKDLVLRTRPGYVAPAPSPKVER